MLTEPMRSTSPSEEASKSEATREIRVALVGVGNCASALVQGLTCYRDSSLKMAVPGLAHSEIGAYRPEHIRIVAAFDIDASKVGRDLSSAILSSPNNTLRFCTPERGGPIVARGPTLDGRAETVAPLVIESDEDPVDVSKTLAAAKTQVVVSFLPLAPSKQRIIMRKQP